MDQVGLGSSCGRGTTTKSITYAMLFSF